MALEEFIDIDTFMKEIEEGQDDIGEAMRRQTAKCAFYGIQHTKAKKQASKFALSVRTVDAILTKRYRKEMVDADERPTADIVKAMVVTNPQMSELLKQQLDADEIETICKVAYDAFKTRRDMLTGLGHLTTQAMRTGNQIATARDSIKDGYRERRAERQKLAQEASENGGSQIEAVN
jgi:hypothetical protein